MKTIALLFLVGVTAVTAGASGVIERSMQSIPAGATDLVPRGESTTHHAQSLGINSPKISGYRPLFHDFSETSEVLSVYIFKDRNPQKPAVDSR